MLASPCKHHPDIVLHMFTCFCQQNIFVNLMCFLHFRGHSFCVLIRIISQTSVTRGWPCLPLIYLTQPHRHHHHNHTTIITNTTPPLSPQQHHHHHHGENHFPHHHHHHHTIIENVMKLNLGQWATMLFFHWSHTQKFPLWILATVAIIVFPTKILHDDLLRDACVSGLCSITH